MKRKKLPVRYYNRHKSENSTRKRLIIEWVIYAFEIALVVALAYVIINMGIAKTFMNGDSMQGTLSNGEEILLNKMIYKISDIERNDVVAYRQNSSEHNYLTIKRVIGLPGEKIRITEGIVYINDEPLDEKINVEPMKTGGLATEEIRLEDNEYFLLGDNRNNSQDSRFSSVGTIVKDDVIGKVWIRIKPFNFVNSLNLKEGDS